MRVSISGKREIPRFVAAKVVLTGSEIIFRTFANFLKISKFFQNCNSIFTGFKHVRF